MLLKSYKFIFISFLVIYGCTKFVTGNSDVKSRYENIVFGYTDYEQRWIEAHIDDNKK
jgi:hypothetical protein